MRGMNVIYTDRILSLIKSSPKLPLFRKMKMDKDVDDFIQTGDCNNLVLTSSTPRCLEIVNRMEAEWKLKKTKNAFLRT